MCQLTNVLTAAGLAATIAICSASFAAAQSDDFNDNAIGNQWSPLIDAPDELTLAEQNQRLEVLANAPSSPNFDALYLSNGPSGFMMGTDADFEIAIDYSFTNFSTANSSSGDALALAFGVGRDLDGTDSAAIGFGYLDTGFGAISQTVVGSRINDNETVVPLGLGLDMATFTITYDSAGDDLTFSDGTSTYILEDTVQSIWNASGLFVSFGGRGSGFSTESGDAYFDNFEIRSGNVILIPAPGALAVLSIAAIGWNRRRRA